MVAKCNKWIAAHVALCMLFAVTPLRLRASTTVRYFLVLHMCYDALSTIVFWLHDATNLLAGYVHALYT